jgi:hypothetical protein
VEEYYRLETVGRKDIAVHITVGRILKVRQCREEGNCSSHYSGRDIND